MKTCSVCGKEKDPEDFPLYQGQPHGTMCRRCKARRSQELLLQRGSVGRPRMPKKVDSEAALLEGFSAWLAAQKPVLEPLHLFIRDEDAQLVVLP